MQKMILYRSHDKGRYFYLKNEFTSLSKCRCLTITIFKIFLTIFLNNYVASSHFASFHEILRNSYEPCKMLKFREGRWFAILPSSLLRKLEYNYRYQ